MATVMAVSSWVARGTVGLRALQPPLERLGHDVIAVPTILLSSHLGYPKVGGEAVAPGTLDAMLEALEANRWLDGVAAVVTGYLPSPAHVAFMARVIDRVRERRSDVAIVCDPVLGDAHTGLYVPEAVAAAVRERLLPRATHLKLNAFELAWLSGTQVAGLSGAVAAARALAVPVLLASSIPAEGDALANLLVTPEGASLCTVPREPSVPQGTGDLLVALFVGHLLNGKALPEAAGAAVAGVACALTQSRGHDEMRLVGEASWAAAAPLPMNSLADDVRCLQ